ncbi:MAG: UDP-N-acetylmuramate--L-alanine ligase [Epsilonproteobacteria bacterium]|nr:MAG: UDP-N-acetylmuramate--L-alanine ligase [Campylobacterota bacterium]
MNIHFVGIGGIGLSALARFLNNSGHNISGSDMHETSLTKQLESENIKITIPHNKSAIHNQDILIYSAAINDNNKEIQEAKKQSIKIISRKEALPIVLENKKNYSVCGAHGKSTTTAMLTAILQSSALIGAVSKEFNSNFRYIGNTICFEADESDGSFLYSNPYCAIVTNVEPEHMEYYNYNKEIFFDSYKQFLSKATIRVVNAEDEFLNMRNMKNCIKLYPSKDIKDIKYNLKNGEPYTSFVLKDIGDFEVWGFGKHIAIDASLAILAGLNEIGLEQIKENLLKYRGIKKRFDIVQKEKNFVVIDDYAHHPTEIKATIKATKMYCLKANIKDIIVIWQPHKYSRTKDNLEAFKTCFKGCKELIILPVWTVNEPVLSINFKKEFEFYNLTFAKNIKAKQGKIDIFDENKNLIKTITKSAVLAVGAGDITRQIRV